MPRWARFLSCSFTGLLLSLAGFFVAAYWFEGGPRFWVELFESFSTLAFWSLVWLFALLAAITLLLARIGVNLYGWPDGLSGLVSGGLVSLAYVSFLVSSHSADWGGVALGIQRAWPAGAVFAAPLGFAGAFIAWLWDRLD